jgi:hypothetical protein
VRTTSDIRILRDNASAVRRLPRDGIRVVVPGLNADESQNFQKRISTYVRACGCAEGGAMALVGATSVLASLAWRAHVRGPRWSDFAMTAAGLVLAGLLGGLGKVVGLFIARVRFERWCNAAIEIIDSRRAAIRSV